MVGGSLGRGYDAARTFLRENKPVLNSILKDICKNLNSGAPIAGKIKDDEGWLPKVVPQGYSAISRHVAALDDVENAENVNA